MNDEQEVFDQFFKSLGDHVYRVKRDVNECRDHVKQMNEDAKQQLRNKREKEGTYVYMETFDGFHDVPDRSPVELAIMGCVMFGIFIIVLALALTS